MIKAICLAIGALLLLSAEGTADQLDLHNRATKQQVLSIVSGSVGEFSNGWTRTYRKDGILHASCGIDWKESEGTWKVTADGKLCNRYDSFQTPFICGGRDGFCCWQVYTVPESPVQLQYIGKFSGKINTATFTKANWSNQASNQD